MSTEDKPKETEMSELAKGEACMATTESGCTESLPAAHSLTTTTTATTNSVSVTTTKPSQPLVRHSLL